MARVRREPEAVAELATLLARGFARLTEKRPELAVSGGRSSQNRLDSPPEQSTPVSQETASWKRASSAKSAGFGR